MLNKNENDCLILSNRYVKMSYKVTDININGLCVNFKFETNDCRVANHLCQILTSEITTVAIDNVSMYTNISPHHDEYIAHRLALVPLLLPSEGSNNENTELELNVHATGNVYNVTTKDLKSNTSIVPVDEDILICKLFQGQSIHLKAYVKYGTDDENAKWSPVSTVTFRPKDDSYYFQMETLGTIEPTVLINKAIDILAH
jgi:DNA-directed RNA polymerase I and III subunit RPAC1